MTLNKTFNKPEQDRALVKAVKDCDIMALIDACNKGADPNVRDPATGRNLLFIVMDQLSTEDGKKMSGSLWAHLLALTQRGASGSLPGNDGITPLHYAFDKHYSMFAAVLILQEGSLLDMPDPRTGDTPFHRALSLFLSPDADIDTTPFDVLVTRNADPAIPNKAGLSALDIARAATSERAGLAVEKMMGTAVMRQRVLRDKAKQNPLKLKTS